jgi:hypothetical protein
MPRLFCAGLHVLKGHTLLLGTNQDMDQPPAAVESSYLELLPSHSRAKTRPYLEAMHNH